jgi:DNA-binding NtrC family response regulator
MITEFEPADPLPGIYRHLADVADLAWKGGISLPELLTILRHEFISRGLEAAGGNQVLLADAIGIHRNTLARHMAAVGVPAPEKRRQQCALRR